jgi:hypothetical protein
MDLPSLPSLGPTLLIVLAVVCVVLLGVAVVLLVKLVRMFSIVRSDEMPLQGKLTFWGALIYTVFPVDVLLDPVYLDDVGVLAGALAYLTHLASTRGITRNGRAKAQTTKPGTAKVDIDKAPIVP